MADKPLAAAKPASPPVDPSLLADVPPAPPSGGSYIRDPATGELTPAPGATE